MTSDKTKPGTEEVLVSSESSESPRMATQPEPMDKEQVIEKVRNVPLDKLRDIITNQIDLEIRLKHKELTLTNEEVGKCESQMITLRNLLKVPREKSFANEPNEFTIKYYDLLNRSLSVHEQTPAGGYHSEPPHHESNDLAHQMPTHTYRTRSTTSSLRPSTHSSKPMTIGCLYRRTDGIIVKLTCPGCQRSNFSSAQGFLNHSRIAHTQEYTSQDAAALICGEILPDYEQDDEGLNSLKNLKEKSLDPSKNLNVNEIYFNGLSSTLNTVHPTTIEKSMSPLSTGEEPIKKPQEPEPSELMKKLIKNGVTKDKDSYETMINDVKSTVQIEAEEEEEEKAEEEVSKKRRRSRVGMEDAVSSLSTTPTDKPPLPKIKIKLRSDDKKKRRSR